MNWSRFAEQNGLTLEPGGSPDGGARLSGKYQNHALIIETVHTGGARQGTTSTHIKFDVKRPESTRVEVRYAPAAMSAKMRQTLPRYYPEVVEIGDPEVDKHFVIISPSAAYAKGLVGREGSVFTTLDRLFKQFQYGALRLESTQVDFEMPAENKDEKLQSALDLVSDVVDAIGRSG